jgi:hypothetical protein
MLWNYVCIYLFCYSCICNVLVVPTVMQSERQTEVYTQMILTYAGLLSHFRLL